MGLIRKTMSISTLGLVSWDSKKERLRAAEAELEAARGDLERTSKKEALLKERVLAAERRAEEAELAAIRDARKAGRRGARRARVEQSGPLGGVLGTVRDLSSSVADSTRETKTRLAADLEPRLDELHAKTARARKKAAKRTKKARKRALKKGEVTRAQLTAAAEEASATVRAKARKLAS